ncbi:MAG: WD40/YVTN/BNR-like repeat-containing protein, partial [Flavobacteriales bacterium]
MKTRVAILTAFLVCVFVQVSAKIHPVENRIGSGTNTSANLNSTFVVDFTGALQSNESDLLIENYVFLGINYDNATQGTGIYSVNLEVKRYGITGNLVNTQTEILVLDNSTSQTINDKHIVAFEGFYKLECRILSITVNGVTQNSLPGHLFVGSKVVVDRLTNFAPYASTPVANSNIDVNYLDNDNDGVSDHIRVSWTDFYSAEYYDLEWVHKDNYSTDLNNPIPAGNLEISFKDKNSTRISTDLYSYDIPLIFEQGYVLFRLRPVGRLTGNPNIPVFGKWSTADSEVLNVASAQITHPIVYVEGLDQNLIWQNNATFAENGKRKDVISYYDGGNKNRQTVTSLSSLKIAVVGETIYDYTGRPALQVLPSPVVNFSSGQGNEVSTIRFYRDFNIKGTTTEAIAAKHFDPDGGSLCEVNAPQLSALSGASNYYSPQNPFDDSEVDFVPNAYEYPYSQTEYTPDNTGRIRRQGGVGPDHQLNSDHETFYYYGTPHQIQLDRLFGSEAGNAAHYKKNLVVDPNGVVSVSYLDMADKVIATALVGASPEGLSELSQTINYQDNNQTVAEFQNNHSVIESDLFNENAEGESITNTVNVNGNSITFSNVLLVPEEELYTFNYDFIVNPFNPECFENLCMHCIYDLELSIVDECGVEIYTSLSTHGPMVGRFVQGSTGVEFVLDCTQGVPFQLDLPQIQIQLSRGEYTISKVLTVNESAVDSYVEQIMATQQDDECVLTLEDFIQIYESQVNFDDCSIEFNCSECLEELGDRFLFIATQPYSYEVNQLLYDWRYEQCKEKCAVGSYCSTGYQAMIMDMIPTSGQYGATEFGPGYNVSVYNGDNLLPKNLSQSNAYWKHPIIELNGYIYNQYLDDYGNQAKVQVFANSNNTYSPAIVNQALIFYESGVAYTVPENLQNLSDFVAAFQTSWARSLVYYHPEYCFYESCREYGDFQSPQDYLTSDQFDALLNSANTFDDAFNLGLIELNGGVYSLGNWFDETPTGEVPFSTDPADINGADQIYDPFVVRGNQLGEYYSGVGPDFLGTLLENAFDNYTPSSGSTPSLSIQELSVYLNYCPVVPNAPECAAPFNNLGNLFGSNFGNSSSYIEQKDAMWIFARSLYLSKKFELQHGRDTKYTIDECPGYGECIGNGNFSVIQNDFYESDSNPIYEFQPCNPEYADLYLDKDRRFPTPQAITVDIPSGTAVTQQCEDEYNLQNLLNFINTDHSLLATDLQIGILPQFSGIYGQVSSFSNPMSMLTQWDASVLANGNLQVLWNTPTSTLCTLNVSKPALLASWEDVYYFAQLNGTTGQSVFEVTIHYYENGTTYHQDIVQGSISCVEFESCSNGQEPICNGTQLKDDFLVLCNALIADGVFYNTFSLSSNYSSYITPAIIQFFGSNYNPSLLQWKFININPEDVKFGIYIGGIELVLAGPNSGGNLNFLSGVNEIVSLECVYSPSGATLVDVHYLKNGVIKTFKGSNLGEKQAFCNCITPPSPCCQGVGYEGWERVKKLVSNLIINTNISNGNPIGVSMYSGTDFNQFFEPYTNSVYASTPMFAHVSGTEVMTYNIGDCDLTLTLMNDPSSTSWTFPNISSITDFILVGDPDLDGYFYQFSMTGSDGTNQFIINGQWCIPLKACTDTPPCGSVLPLPEIIIEQADPCVETLNNVILQNATSAYQQWYEDFTSTLASDYIAHCINSVDENLRVSFMETEYHYTLYYYDQSGNLIRTVPPAGVKRLDIFSPSEPVAQRINEDRTYGTRRIFTFHNLQTTYVYNSLNQLVSQSIPDHDKMTVWETTLPIGIPNDFINNEFNFPSASFGFAAGAVSGRGHLYKSGDAGETWTRANGLVAADISKVKMLTSLVGFAIAEKGVILRTADGGNSWDMLNTYSLFG